MKTYMMRCLCFILLFRFTLSSFSQSEMSVGKAFFATSEILEYQTENYEDFCSLVKFSAIAIGKDSLNFSVEGLSSKAFGDVNKVFSLARDLAYGNSSWRKSYTVNLNSYKGDVLSILHQLKMQSCKPQLLTCSNMVIFLLILAAALLGLRLSWHLGWTSAMTKLKAENIGNENRNAADKSSMDEQDNDSISSLLSEGNSDDPSVQHKKEVDADGDRKKNEENKYNNEDVKLVEDSNSIEEQDFDYRHYNWFDYRDLNELISRDYYPNW